MYVCCCIPCSWCECFLPCLFAKMILFLFDLVCPASWFYILLLLCCRAVFRFSWLRYLIDRAGVASVSLVDWLPGPIPESLGQLTNLAELSLNGNNLSGKSDPRIVCFLPSTTVAFMCSSVTVYLCSGVRALLAYVATVAQMFTPLH